MNDLSARRAGPSTVPERRSTPHRACDQELLEQVQELERADQVPEEVLVAARSALRRRRAERREDVEEKPPAE